MSRSFDARLLLLLAVCVQQMESARIRAGSTVLGGGSGGAIIGGESCIPLKNEGVFSTVEVLVGTPPQKMNVVADTGSDSLIVASCDCVDHGACPKGSNCFNAKKSTSLVIDDKNEWVITFGSGPVTTRIATDEAAIGNVSATMTQSLLLMTDHDLGSLELEGILGLGLPPSDAELARTKPHKNMVGIEQEGQPIMGEGLLDIAGVLRFSMCFNMNGWDGVLRVGNEVPMGHALGGIGVFHWGVGFNGLTVGQGSSAVKMSICDESAMEPGQVTPCGAIVDSGTTLILGPTMHISELFSTLCDVWSRCRDVPVVQALRRAEAAQNGTGWKAAVLGTANLLVKNVALLDAISGCNLTGLPSLVFSVRGADGTPLSLELPPEEYIMQMVEEKALLTKTWLGRDLVPQDYEFPVQDSGSTEVCIPAFATDDYTTKSSGPVWLFGTPFFYRYTVGYDKGAKPPALSFSEGQCGQCSHESSGREVSGSSLAEKAPHARRLLGKIPRLPKFDLSHGL